MRKTSTIEGKKMELNREVAAKVLNVVDAGLCKGVGVPEPGKMCVEAAVCYALGLPHSDDPGCVSPALRSLKIRLNDSGWSSNTARAKGLRRLAIAQLGSKDALGEKEFLERVVEMTIRKIVPVALRAAAPLQTEKHKAALEDAANRCEAEGTKDAANAAANAAAYAANAAAYAARDQVLSDFAEEVVKILITMKAPGSEWLDLTEVA